MKKLKNIISEVKSNQVIDIALQVPKGLNLSENRTQAWVDGLRVVTEEGPDTITGLKESPTFTWRDIAGSPIQKMLTFWKEFLLIDPDTKNKR